MHYYLAVGQKFTSKLDYFCVGLYISHGKAGSQLDSSVKSASRLDDYWISVSLTVKVFFGQE